MGFGFRVHRLGSFGVLGVSGLGCLFFGFGDAFGFWVVGVFMASGFKV